VVSVDRYGGVYVDGKLYVNGKEYKEDGSMRAASRRLTVFCMRRCYYRWCLVCLHSQRRDETTTIIVLYLCCDELKKAL